VDSLAQNGGDARPRYEKIPCLVGLIRTPRRKTFPKPVSGGGSKTAAVKHTMQCDWGRGGEKKKSIPLNNTFTPAGAKITLREG